MIKIAVMLDFVGAYGRSILHGVMEYANLKSDWEFLRQPMYMTDPRWAGWRKADGIVTMVHSVNEIRNFRRSGVPIVNTARTIPAEQLRRLKIPTVLPDDAAVGRVAFDYLWQRQFRSFGFCGHPTASWSIVRRDAFAERCRSEGVQFSATADERQVNVAWVRSLPRPCAIFAANDHYGWLVIDVCRENRIAVPEELAVLGVDNDPVLNNMARPTLSSVEIGATRIGFEAAKMLDQLMQKKPLENGLVEIVPTGIFTRHSTDILSIDDPAVAEAAKFIREHASEPIGVEDVIAEVAMSRRNLERRFKRAMRRSLLDEILRVRLDRATRLLRETGLDIERIAQQSGFNSHVRFTTVFHQILKQTPTAYRKSHRNGSV